MTFTSQGTRCHINAGDNTPEIDKTAYLRALAGTTARKKILQTRRGDDPAQLSTTDRDALPGEAQDLKQLLLASTSYQLRTRFSFAKLRRVIVPPVQIPPELALPNAITHIVAGANIPMTKAMWMRHRARLVRRLPQRVDERVAW
ncbi:hypothetical protein PsorP6_014924 [Peronosclerospora sorghi]|uniref:Uncharacterized protein n=1 Tax=Peronosclerospora sorghi TaxID=230839 RepID=A0ACC0VT91_9STRA|nr:hypothetical protein PsorP6_014924 [Peronosclerospora sorghi]